MMCTLSPLRRIEIVAAASASVLGLALLGWGIGNQLALGGGMVAVTRDLWFWWLLVCGAALAAAGTYRHAVHGRRGGIPLLALGSLLGLPAATYAIELIGISMHWSLSGVATGGITVAGRHWAAQWLMLSLTALVVVALDLLALTAAWRWTVTNRPLDSLGD